MSYRMRPYRHRTFTFPVRFDQSTSSPYVVQCVVLCSVVFASRSPSQAPCTGINRMSLQKLFLPSLSVYPALCNSLNIKASCHREAPMPRTLLSVSAAFNRVTFVYSPVKCAYLIAFHPVWYVQEVMGGIHWRASGYFCPPTHRQGGGLHE
eukprot:scpid60965/ scgid11972/ 